jgi:hypothetical protein
MELCHSKRGFLHLLVNWNPSGPNLLDEPLKDFIVNPADLPWKWVKRLISSGKRVNHDSW